MDSPQAEVADAEIVRLAVTQDWAVDLTIGPWVWVALLVVGIIFVSVRFWLRGSLFSKAYELDSAELGLGDSKVTFKPNMNDKSVAYKIWVELSTRKIGLPIDFDDDVIEEIYDSWYGFFSVTRELVKDIPVSKVRNPSTKKIINLSIDVLNLGLRPHLTKWQARFRRWYDRKVASDPEVDLHPQDIQKKFPQYDELVADMREVNDRLMQYRKKMDELVHI